MPRGAATATPLFSPRGADADEPEVRAVDSETRADRGGRRGEPRPPEIGPDDRDAIAIGDAVLVVVEEAPERGTDAEQREEIRRHDGAVDLAAQAADAHEERRRRIVRREAAQRAAAGPEREVVGIGDRTEHLQPCRLARAQ